MPSPLPFPTRARAHALVVAVVALAATLGACGEDATDAQSLCRNLDRCVPDDFAEVYRTVDRCVNDLEAEQDDADARQPGCGDAQRAFVRCAARLGCADLEQWLDAREMAACEAETQAAAYVCETPPDQRDAGPSLGPDGGI